MILRFTDKLPKALYLDSSMILNAATTGGKFHNECASFLRRIGDEGIRCATTSLSLDEIWYVLIKNKVEHLTGHFLVKSYKTNPDFMSISDLVDVYTCNPKMFT